MQPLINRGVRRGRVEGGRRKGLLRRVKVYIVVEAGGSYVDAVGLLF